MIANSLDFGDFRQEKNQLSIEQLLCCKMYTFDQYLRLELTTTYTVKQWIIFSSTS